MITELAYTGNIGVMELAKFHSKANPSQKEEFTKLMKEKVKATKDSDQQKVAVKIWSLVQSVTGVKLQHMEQTIMSFKETINEQGKLVVPASKPRAKGLHQILSNKVNAAGSHKNKKKEQNLKHKNRVFESQLDFVLALVEHQINEGLNDDDVYIYHPEKKHIVKKISSKEVTGHFGPIGQHKSVKSMVDHVNKHKGDGHVAERGNTLKHKKITEYA